MQFTCYYNNQKDFGFRGKVAFNFSSLKSSCPQNRMSAGNPVICEEVVTSASCDFSTRTSGGKPADVLRSLSPQMFTEPRIHVSRCKLGLFPKLSSEVLLFPRPQYGRISGEHEQLRRLAR